MTRRAVTLLMPARSRFGGQRLSESAGRWFARADLRYLHGDSDVKVSGDKVGNAKLNPVVVGLGLGVRF